MKAFSLLVLLCMPSVWAQPAPSAADKGDTVVAVFDDGKNLTEAEFQSLIQTHPSWQKLPREQVFHEYGLLRTAANLFQEQKLGEQSPYKETLAFDAMYQMANCWMSDTIKVDQEEIQKFYDERKPVFRLLKMSGLKVAFGGAPAPEVNDQHVLASRPVKKILTEEEAKAKAEGLAAEIRGGADFHKMVKLYSDDVTTKDKGGDLGEPWSPSSSIPGDWLKTAFTLKEGEISEPMKMADGYWLLRIEEVSYTPLKDLQDGILDQIRQQKGNNLMTDLDKNTKIEIPPPPAGGEKGDTVVAVFEDHGKLTLDDYKAILRGQPAWQGMDRQNVIRKYGVLRKAALLAEELKLADKSPYKEMLAFNSLYQMFKCWGQKAEGDVTVQPDEVQHYYASNKEQFKKVKVSGLKVAFGDAGSGKSLTEEKAKAKAESLAAEFRKGTDFKKLVQQNSDDAGSKAKDGELGDWSSADKIPEDQRTAIADLHAGEVSAPIRESNGYWLLHIDAIDYQPLKDVQDAIFAQVRTTKINQMWSAFDKNIHVTIPHPGGQVPGGAPSDLKK